MLHICDVYIQYKMSTQGKIGGLETYINSKFDYFSSRKDVIYTAIVPGKKYEQKKLNNARIIYIPKTSWKFSLKKIKFQVQFFLLRNIIKEIKPDVIEFCCPKSWLWIVKSLRKNHAIQSVFWHNIMPNGIERNLNFFLSKFVANLVIKIIWKAYQFSYKNLDSQIVATKIAKKQIEQNIKAKLSIIPLGIDLELFHPKKNNFKLRQSISAKDNTCIIFFPNRLVDYKGFPLIAKIFPKLIKSCNVKLVIAGSGNKNCLISAKNLSSEYPNSVFYIGCIYDRDLLAQWYASSDIMLSLGNETFCLSAAEAMASGCPVVSIDEGAVVDFVNESGAGILSSRDPNDLYSKTKEFILSKKYKETKEIARKFAEENFNVEKNFDELTRHYKTISEEKKLKNRQNLFF